MRARTLTTKTAVVVGRSCDEMSADLSTERLFGHPSHRLRRVRACLYVMYDCTVASAFGVYASSAQSCGNGNYNAVGVVWAQYAGRR